MHASNQNGIRYFSDGNMDKSAESGSNIDKFSESDHIIDKSSERSTTIDISPETIAQLQKEFADFRQQFADSRPETKELIALAGTR
jgi:hypothetical protein